MRAPMPRFIRRIAGDRRVVGRTTGIILAAFSIFYVAGYFSSPFLAGGPSWWRWNDQSLYLKSAQAFWHLDFRASEHTCPILYSLLSAPFVELMPLHPFFVVNLICFLICTAGFISIGSRIIGDAVSALLWLLVISIPWTLAESFIIPWTSTLAAALTTMLLLCCANERFASGLANPLSYLLFGLLGSLLSLVRPLDFLISTVFYIYVAVQSIAAAHIENKGIFHPRLLRIATALILGILAGLSIMVMFNLKVYGELLSPYMQISRDVGLHLGSIPQKFVSLFNDSQTLFLVKKQTFVAKFPWLILTIAMIPVVICFGSNLLRLITVASVIHLTLYLAYNDLTPRNIFYFKLTHYFKMWLPYFALITVTGVVLLWRLRSSIATRYVAAAGLVITLALCSLGFSIRTVPIHAFHVDPHTISVEPAKGEQATVSFIDFPDLKSDNWIGAVTGNRVTADGRLLHRLGDVHVFQRCCPTPGTPSPKDMAIARVFFTRPLTFRKLLIKFDESFTIPDQLPTKGGDYTIFICRPHWARNYFCR